MARADDLPGRALAEGRLEAAQRAWPLDGIDAAWLEAWLCRADAEPDWRYGYAQENGALFPAALATLLASEAARHPGLALLYQHRGGWRQSKTPLLQKLLAGGGFPGPAYALRAQEAGWSPAALELAACLLADGVPCLLLDDLTPRLGADPVAPPARLRYLLLSASEAAPSLSSEPQHA
nr:hypothetical protein [Chromobacterium sp. ASV5]